MTDLHDCVGQYTWTIVTLGLIVFQMKYILTNIFNGTSRHAAQFWSSVCFWLTALGALIGLIWFVFPVSLVVCNDCFAFFCGKLFGKKFVKTPFLRLSPNKTWEGFIGAFICTIVFGYFSSAWLAKVASLLDSYVFRGDGLTCCIVVPMDDLPPRKPSGAYK